MTRTNDETVRQSAAAAVRIRSASVGVARIPMNSVFVFNILAFRFLLLHRWTARKIKIEIASINRRWWRRR